MNIDVVQPLSIELKLGLRLKNDVVLIRLRIECVYLPLTECVIQRGIDLVRRDVES